VAAALCVFDNWRVKLAAVRMCAPAVMMTNSGRSLITVLTLTTGMLQGGVMVMVMVRHLHDWFNSRADGSNRLCVARRKNAGLVRRGC